MTIRRWSSVPAALLLFSLQTAAAQDYDFHPALSDRFLFTTGAFKSDSALKVSASGSLDINRSEIDFGNTIGVDEKTTIFNGQLRWQLGQEQKWSLWGQYFKNSSTGTASLEKDVEWQGDTFLAGTSVGGGVRIEVIRGFIGRSLIRKPQHDLGIGAGLHSLKLAAFIEGQAVLEDGTAKFRQDDASTTAPLPNLGLWYNYSPARNWLLHARFDWLSASIGDYDGTFWNNSIGVDYQFARHFGVDLSYQFFDIDLDINKSDWKGGVNLTYKGPVLSLTANW